MVFAIPAGAKALAFWAIKRARTAEAVFMVYNLVVILLKKNSMYAISFQLFTLKMMG